MFLTCPSRVSGILVKEDNNCRMYSDLINSVNHLFMTT